MAYVFIKTGNSPRPGVFVLERSIDGGQTWKPWQYFADTMSDCNSFFGLENYEESITSDDSVVCTTEYSKVVPLEGGEVSHWGHHKTYCWDSLARVERGFT